MKVTLLGHASVLVELDGFTCLMDPVFFDPFEEGAVVSCPKRVVHVEKLPQIDILIVSHRHPDHFDIASLARVDRGCVAICPADPLIVYALRKLGFAEIRPVEPMGEISGGDFELYPTRSEVASVREFGMVFKDKGGVFWNQVDTSIADLMIAAVRQRFGRPDLLFSKYASQNFEFFESLSATFPFEEHRENLDTVLKIRPRMVAPGSAGFRFSDNHAWLNAFLFPISAERFVADLALLGPEIEARIMKPGDLFEIGPNGVLHRPGSSPLAACENDDRRLIEFDPTAPIPDLADPNRDAYPLAHLAETTDRFIARGLGTLAADARASSDRVIALYRKHQARYALGLVFPDSTTRWYHFDFSPQPPRLTTGFEPPSAADIVHQIAASALVGWIERRKSFFYVRAYSRRFSTLHQTVRSAEGLQIQPLALPDLLIHYLLNLAPESETAAQRRIDLEIAALSQTGEATNS